MLFKQVLTKSLFIGTNPGKFIARRRPIPRNFVFYSMVSKMKKSLLSCSLVVLIILCSGWGFLIHRTVNQLAVYQLRGDLQEFFFENRDYLVRNAPRPDIRRNEDSTEETKHFIDLEAFGDSAAWKMPMDWETAVQQYTRDTLLEYGYVPYHIIYMKEKLTQAFRAKNKDSILFYAADLGHYIGDAHVPLHTTINYDGQLTDQKGVHSLWETVVPDLELNGYDLYSNRKAKYLKYPAKAIWNSVRASSALVNVVLQTEREISKRFTDSTKFVVQIRNGRESKRYSNAFATAYGEALKPMINERLLASANMIADFWYTAWVDAGKPDMGDITKDYSKADKKELRYEMSAYKKNKLVSDSLLIARKASGAR
jgi:hypothetical protein